MSDVRSIPAVVASSIEHHPARVALLRDGPPVSYAQLGRAIAAAADHPAIRLGVGTTPGASSPADPPPVIVIGPLDPEGLVVQLGILFAGRICAPLDSTMPIARLVDTIARVGGPVICLDATVAAALDDAGVTCVHPAELRLDAMLDAPERSLRTPDTDPGTAALLCFTSGSTGEPKGVLVPHSQLVSSAAFAATGPDDVVAITSPPSFFASMLQSLMALAVGGTGIHLDLATTSGRRLHDRAIESGLTQITGTTTHMRELANHSLDAPITTLWGIDLGGEPTTRADLELLRRAFPSARVRNIYGSSEAGRIAHLDIGPQDPLPPPGPIPAGRASDDRVLGLFDEAGRPTPSGEPGRIAVRRPEPFLGYWNDPERTAALTITDDQGRLWILSGDFGRLDDDGCLVVIGRTDDQIKIRGRFVNPAAVDALLVADPRVSLVSTIAVPPEAPTQLRSIVVAAPDATVTESDLRHLLAQTLPVSSLPRHIVFVDHLPLTTRGKVDRNALALLPVPDAKELPADRNEGRSVVEDCLLDIVQELLEADVAVTEDVFAAGADSLLAVELIEAIADEFGVRISPAQLGANPSVAELAVLLRDGPDDDNIRGLTPLHRSGGPTSAFWLTVTDEHLGPARVARLTTPMNSYCAQIIGTTSPDRYLDSIHAIGAANAENIIAVATASTVLIGYSAGTVLALETASELERRGHRPDLVLLIDPPTEEGLSVFRDAQRIPSLWRHPRKHIGMRRQRRSVMRRPEATADVADRITRFVNRHAHLILEHTMRPYDGPVVLIQSEEYVAAGGTPLTARSVGTLAPVTILPGTHHTVLVEPQPTADAILAVLRDHGLAD